MNFQRIHTGWAIAVAVVLSIIAAFCLFNSYFLPYSPDCSIYSLHARNFLEFGDRYTSSHESKGFWFTLLMSPTVALLGPTQAAAATTILLLYLVSAGFIFLLLREFVGWRTAIIVAPAWITLAFSPLMWGGRTRPEDFAIALFLAVLYAATKTSPKAFLIGGVLTAMAAFTKISFIIAPGGMLLAALIWQFVHNKDRRIPLKLLGAAALGAFAFSAVTIIWITAFDDIGGWYRQNLQWPAEYKRMLSDSPLFQKRNITVLDFIREAKLSMLFLASFGGLIFAAQRKAGLAALLLAVYLGAEILRVQLELANWRYLINPMVPALLLSISLFGRRREDKPERAIGWLVAVVVIALPFHHTVLEQFQLWNRRVRGHEQAPLEALVNKMKLHYQKGDTVYVNGNNYYPILELGAPRPYYILPVLLSYVSSDEIQAALAYWKENPPNWYIENYPAQSGVSFVVEGAIDELYFSYKETSTTRPLPRNGAIWQEGDIYLKTPKAQRNIRETLLTNGRYQLVVDTGAYQAWRRMPGGDEPESTTLLDE